MAHSVVAVTAHVRSDPAERGSPGLALKVMVETVGRVKHVGDVPRVAVTGLQDRFKPREREVLWQVLVCGVRDRRVDLRPAARRAGRRVRRAAVAHTSVVGRSARVMVAKVLRVTLPAHLGRVELLEQGRHAGRVDAAIGADRPVCALSGGHLTVVGVRLQRSRGIDVPREVVVERTVSLGVGLRRLAAHQ